MNESAGRQRRLSALTLSVPSDALDPLLFCQLAPRPAFLDSGEVRLYRQVLLDAVADLVAGAHWSPSTVMNRQRQVAARIAGEWLDGAPTPLTFADCCSALGLSPVRTRAKILRFASSHVHRPGKPWLKAAG
jgi:hypothetical protein